MGMFKGGKVTSVNDLKSDLDKVQERIDNPSTWVKSIPEGEIRVRFMTEPDEWFEYSEHWSNLHQGYHACTGETCPTCEKEPDARTSQRYLANAYGIKEVRNGGKNPGAYDLGKVIPLKIPMDVAQRLMAKYERSHEDPAQRTLTDRDYTITRQGTGRNTMYDVEKEDKSSFTLDVEPYDLEDILADQYRDVFGERPDAAEQPRVDEQGDEVPFDPPPASDDEDVLTLEDLQRMDADELRNVCSILEIDVPEDATMTQMIDMIMEQAT